MQGVNKELEEKDCLLKYFVVKELTSEACDDKDSGDFYYMDYFHHKGNSTVLW